MPRKPVRVRFAPSPTGLLHVGGARTALFNWLYARSKKGKFILRIEDTDKERNTKEANEAIFDGLKWLGLDWDEGPDVEGDFGPYRQSKRKKIYNSYFAKLKKAKLVYKDDDGAMRFKSPNKDVTIDDLICGPTKFENREDPDMTIRRADGSYVFHFVSVVDDIEMQISHVIRGEDHLSNTPKHIDLYKALGAKPPKFGHIPLILNPDGSKMSKRDAGGSIQEYSANGFHPEAVFNYLALLGWSPKDDTEVMTRKEILKKFKLEQINRSNCRFDFDKAEWFSAQHIARLEPAELREALTPFLRNRAVPSNKAALSDDILLELRNKLKRFSEAPKWVAFLFSDDYPRDGEALAKLKTREGIKNILRTLADHLEATSKTWNPGAIDAALDKAATSLDLRKGAVMFPCRVAISGQTGGLALANVLERLGPETSVERIRTTAAEL